MNRPGKRTRKSSAPTVGAEPSVTYDHLLDGGMRDFSSRLMGIAITVGPSAARASLKACWISSLVSAFVAWHPYPFASETMSKKGRSRDGTLGVFSSTANSFRIAYSPLHGTM